jgi:glycosyltransferase involved in cell wall biosynthesis
MKSNPSSCCEPSEQTTLLEGRHSVTCCQCGFRSCVLHIYIGPRNEWRCYKCFAELQDHRAKFSITLRGAIPPSERPDVHAVIVIHGLHICGAARHCLELLRAFNAANVYTTVIASNGGGQWADMFLRNTNELILHTDPSVDASELREIRWHASRRIISMHYDPAISWVMSAQHEAELYAHFHTEPEYGLISRAILLRAGTFCRSVLFPSAATMQSYEHLLAPRPDWWDDKCKVLPNAAPTSLTRPRASQNGREAADFRLAIVSRLDPDKIALPLLIDTLLIVQRSIPALKVRIAGNGIQGRYIEELIRQHGLGEVVELMGWVDNIGEVYEWAHLTFLPSHSETMPYAAIESVQAMRPVVLPELGYFRARTEQNELIRTFKPGDATEAAQAIVGARGAYSDKRGDRSKCFDSKLWQRSVYAAYGIVE